MSSKPPLSPTPRRRTRATATSTAARSTNAVTAATLPVAGVESPARPAALFASAHKRVKPKTTPERGCESPQKKKSSRRKPGSNRRAVNFEPTVVTDSSRGPWPVSVAPPTSATPLAASSSSSKKKKQRKKNSRNLQQRAKPNSLLSPKNDRNLEILLQ